MRRNMDSSDEIEGWSLLRKWSMASATMWFSFVGMDKAISFEGLGAVKLSPDEKRLDFSGKGCTAFVDLTEVAFEDVVSTRLLAITGDLGSLPESVKLLLRTGDRCILAARSEVPS
jgi:hypothetical protein